MRLLFLFLLLSFGAFAQTDSLVLVSTRWQTHKIAKGIVWKQFLFKGNLFNSNQSINILEIEKSKRIDYTIGYDTQVLKHTSEFGKEADALAAVNGTFFDIKKGNTNCDTANAN